jgi:hypothetical protein
VQYFHIVEVIKLQNVKNYNKNNVIKNQDVNMQQEKKEVFVEKQEIIKEIKIIYKEQEL